MWNSLLKTRILSLPLTLYKYLYLWSNYRTKNTRWYTHIFFLKVLRAFPSKFLKNLAFTISKTNFITYSTPLYNITYIKTSIFLTLHLNILSLLFFIHFLLLLFLTLPRSLSPTVSSSFSTWSRSFSLSLIFALKTSMAWAFQAHHL